MIKTVFISGVSSGIGLVAAGKLDAMGWRVYGAALPNDDFEPVKNSCSERFVALPLDITDEKAVRASAKQIENDIGSLDALVNNAGITIPGALEALSMDAIRQQFEVNIFGHLQVTQAMLPLLRKSDDARIVNVSSLMGKVALPLLGAYSMSKHALEAMNDVLRLELAPFGIRVSIIEMGAVDTAMTASVEERTEQFREHVPAELYSLYEDLYDSMLTTTQKMGQQAISPEKIAKAIIHALTNDKPKTRYVIGIDTLGLTTMRKFTPDEVGDAILKRSLGLK